ncbi:hypothetical protein JGS39_23525 [Streptomyces sp. P01-B04]|uniref:hypothetical protein n=1 Tax=Streptomyces poriferorum TaxID=2798799 RepID=UPI001C5F4A24|nr:hypothetical protein [Streptomyces poriferorum]MBW5251934.1 hypothetical protein [Streptomyces poriferorum]MBW5258567.1 hypothetical protein [Streptomyces poriferorum]
MSIATPPRPLDVTALFPRLAPLARTATRLHPRPGSPTMHDSSVGGPLLWPADEPWPHCPGPHVWDGRNPALSPDDVRWERHIRAELAGRPCSDPNLPLAARYTPQEAAIAKRIKAGRPWPDGLVAVLPLAQLYVRDIPGLRPPGQSEADLLQVLWCPFDHPANPTTTLRWRSTAEITDVLDAPPEPSAMQFRGYLPEPCLLAPEEITEYPHSLELSKELQEELRDWSRWQAAGAAVDSSYSVAPDEFYTGELSVAPGWKVGGWTRWGLTDPMPRRCPECGTDTDPLLTIAGSEWNAGTQGWAPEEDRANLTSPLPLPASQKPTGLDIARGSNLQLHACPVSPDHPHIELIQ